LPIDPADSPATVDDMMAASPEEAAGGDEINVSLDVRLDATGVTSLANDE
jgi:hypothetical protein